MTVPLFDFWQVLCVFVCRWTFCSLFFFGQSFVFQSLHAFQSACKYIKRGQNEWETRSPPVWANPAAGNDKAILGDRKCRWWNPRGDRVPKTWSPWQRGSSPVYGPLKRKSEVDICTGRQEHSMSSPKWGQSANATLPCESVWQRQSPVQAVQIYISLTGKHRSPKCQGQVSLHMSPCTRVVEQATGLQMLPKLCLHSKKITAKLSVWEPHEKQVWLNSAQYSRIAYYKAWFQWATVPVDVIVWYIGDL